MKHEFNILEDQITFSTQLLYHFYVGVIITLFYVVFSPFLIQEEMPGLMVLLVAEVFILVPFVLVHLFYKGKQLNGRLSLKNVLFFNKKLSFMSYLKWSILGIVACFVVYIPLYPIGLFLKDSVFAWLPEWYFDPGFGSSDTELISRLFLVAIFIDGIIAPVMEEVFFRGYLLPRMAYLKNYAPVVNGLLFGLYHFWQPHNYIATIAIGIILSYVVWKTKNVYLGIIIHCFINVFGAIMGYLAATNGLIIAR